MKKILITGAAGFIGSNLAEHLLKEGNLVFGVDNFITGSVENVDRLKANSNFSFQQADIVDLDQDQLSDLVNQKFDEVYHLACPTGVPNLVTLAEEMLLTCSLGTRNVLEIVRGSGAKFLFTSSSEVYGDPQQFPQTEEYTGNVDPVNLRSPYEEGKRYSESLVAMYTRKHGLDGRIVRVFNTYGSYMADKDARVIPKFMNQLRRNIPLSIHGRGEQKRTFCHVADLVDGLIIAMRHGEKGKVYNIGSEEEISIADLAKLMIEISGSNVGIEIIKRPKHDHWSRRPDLAKISSLGWSPKIDLKKGLRLILKEQTAEVV